MPLVFLPDVEALLWWGEATAPRELPALAQRGVAHQAEVVTPEGRRRVDGLKLDLAQSIPLLAAVPAAALPALSGSLTFFVLASKLVLDLLSRERLLPTLVRRGGRVEARWAAALAAGEDAARVAALVRSMPPAAHAVPVPSGGALDVFQPDALLRGFLDAAIDAFVRGLRGGPELPAPPPMLAASGTPRPRSARRRPDAGAAPAATSVLAWEERFTAALGGEQRSFETQGFAERSVHEQLERWSAPALGARDRLRACFRLELPEADGEPFRLRFLLQSPDDPSLLVTAAEVWNAHGRSLAKLGRAFRDPQESLLEALGRAARLFAPIARALTTPKPEQLELDPAGAWAFLGEGAAALAEAGFGVIVPSELTAAGQRRLRLRMRIGGATRKVAGAVSGAAGLSLDELLEVNWEAVIGDQALTRAELARLAKHKAPLVRFRGAWVAVDPRELGAIQRRIAGGPAQIAVRDAVQAALAGEKQEAELAATVHATGGFADLLERLRNGAGSDLEAPRALQGTLRPYQKRGLHWLATMASLGLGACLADDMGLGKTVQLLALLLRRMEQAPDDERPALLVAPTSVIGNWQREAARFAPALQVTPHYGTERARAPREVPRGPGALVLTSYGLLRRDAALLAGVPWSMVALDEAQNIKNAASATARAARQLQAGQRFALTGTPVENRLAELWSILEFANPGLLGPLDRFRREFAVPIERYGDDTAAARLRRVASPFILRRLKSDPTIVPDLPAKNEMKVVCTLTREQATLYKAVVDEELLRIEDSEGMERKGRVLALLTATKQICNHPAQYLSESGLAAPERSGKLARLSEMLEEAIAAGDKALVFSQFQQMGSRLAGQLSARLGCEVAFLHGGTPKQARDECVRRFQEDPHGPRVFVLSLKAGGTGLNLTAASHVFHYDRWWNPAVEDQATDRAYRIGQTRSVQVHKLVCAGTVEDKVDRMLEQKRALAAKVVGGGEQWITELGNDALRELFSLSGGAVIGDAETDEGAAAEARAPRARKRARNEARP